MKRLRSIVRWLGVKRLIASAVLGVVFPLLFAAVVSSEPAWVVSRLYASPGKYSLCEPPAGTPQEWEFQRNERWAFGHLRASHSWRSSRDEVYARAASENGVEIEPSLPRWSDLSLMENGPTPKHIQDLAYTISKSEIRFDNYGWNDYWETAYGWPFRVNVKRILWVHVVNGPSRVAIEPSISLPRGPWTWLIGTEPMTLDVIPSGLALNWLFYAPLSYLLFSVVPVSRHLFRTRRGFCTRCGYDLAGLASCPECGKDRP